MLQHRKRKLLVRERTQLINAFRVHLARLGIAAAQGREGVLAIVADDWTRAYRLMLARA